MSDTNKLYSYGSKDYLERMKERMDEGTNESLIYAALELRFGVEARLKEYIETIEHIPKSQKNDWQVAKLGRSIESAYRTGDKIMLFTIHFPSDGSEIQLMYTPVTKRLQDIAKNIGGYLHFTGNGSFDNNSYWQKLRTLLAEAYSLLLLATSGELIGLPLIHRPTGKINARISIESNEIADSLLKRMKVGEQNVISVTYIDPMSPITFYQK